MVLPYDGFRVSFTSLNPHKLIGVQYEDFHIDVAIYHKEIAPARTIAYEKEIQALREMGLGLGGSGGLHLGLGAAATTLGLLCRLGHLRGGLLRHGDSRRLDTRC